MNENKLESEIGQMYARTDKSQSYEDFAKLYRKDPDTTNLDSMFSRVDKLHAHEPSKGIDFSKARPSKSNLTEAEQVAFKKREAALGLPTFDKKGKLAQSKVDEIEKEMKQYYSKLTAASQDKIRAEKLAAANTATNLEVNRPHVEKFSKLKSAFGSATLNTTVEKFIELTDKQRADVEIKLAIAIKNKKIAAPKDYTPVKFSLLDELRLERGW
jgi:predicted XRE-type DNA-binding protein